MGESDVERRALAVRLAAELANTSGLRTTRLMQRLGELIGEDSASASQPPQTDDPPAVADGIAAAMIEHFLGDVPRPIGIWEPVDGTDPQRFERDDGAINAHWWALPPVLEAKDALLPLRVAFIGESAASGWLYAPQLTPARLLEAHLQHQSPQTFEVLDLSAVNLQMEQMLELACASLQLSPDLLVVYAGNNWPLRLPSQASASLVEMQSAALALRGQGVAGLREVADALTRAEVERTLDVLGSLAGREGVPVVLVVPDVNLADWSRSRSVAWLERDRVDRWHDLHHRARAALVAGDSGGALTLADAMCALDDETCATSHHLRGRALAALGRHAQTADAWRQGVDARAWDNLPTVPSVTSSVRSVMVEKSTVYGFELVDLSAIFGNAGLARDRTLFLDYCHHTPLGMHSAMAAVATAVLGAALPGRTTVAEVDLPTPPRECEAVAAFLTAIYILHYDGDAAAEPIDGNHPIAYWVEHARNRWSGCDAWLLDYLWSRTAPRVATALSAPMRRFVAPHTELQANLVSDHALDVELVEILIERLAVAPGRFAEALHEGNSATQRPVDLLQGAAGRSIHARFANHAGFGHEGDTFHRAQWPRSSFVFVAGEQQPVELKIVWRLCNFAGPYEGAAVLRLNGDPVHRAKLGSRWQRATFRLRPSALVHGYNRLDVDWPALGGRGRAARDRIADELELGRAVDLHPVFGEIHVLETRSLAESGDSAQ